ncbi:MAG: HAMP domain-containing sensor histidine kinase [Clostridia bacterium]
MMKKNSIRNHLTMLFIAITLFIMLIAIIILPRYFNNLVSETFFNTIEKIPNLQSQEPLSGDMYAVQHLMIDAQGKVLTRREDITSHRFFSETLLTQLIDKTQAQNTLHERYVIDLGQTKVYCVIDKVMEVYRVNYMYDIYGSEFRQRLIIGNFILLFCLAIFGVVGMYIYAQFLIKRITKINNKVELIANGQWETPLEFDQADELGYLSNSIENMRVKLMQQDKYKSDMFQSLSHELKTPVMIIKMYAQGVKDSMYPEGDLNKTIDVILEESTKLEDNIQKILLLNKISYLKQRNEKFGEVNMEEVIKNTIKQFHNISKVKFILELEEVYYYGECEKWNVAIENIISNNLRYAKSLIKISLTQEELKIFNDGTHIEFEDINDIFLLFKKGINGENGIGLTITKSIINLFDYNIMAENIKGGVLFTITKLKKYRIYKAGNSI